MTSKPTASSATAPASKGCSPASSAGPTRLTPRTPSGDRSTKDNITTWYGKTAESRIADPADATRIFSWLICESYDDKGNAIVYKYAEENSDGVDFTQVHEKNRTPSTRSANRYLKRIHYGNQQPNRDADWNATDPVASPRLPRGCSKWSSTTAITT